MSQRTSLSLMLAEELIAELQRQAPADTEPMDDETKVYMLRVASEFMERVSDEACKALDDSTPRLFLRELAAAPMARAMITNRGIGL